jgi:hypothetical protein
MHSHRSISLSIGCLALLAGTSTVARAQEINAPDSASICLLNIPDSTLRPVPVYAQAKLVDSTDRPILPGIDLLMQEVAGRVRASLGASADQLPSGAPAVTWRALDGTLDVVVHRDGNVSSAVRKSEDFNRADTTAAQLLERALGAVAADGHYFMIWPEGIEHDSVAFRIAMHYPMVSGQGVVGTLSLRQGFPLFFVPVPKEEPVEVERQPKVDYPVWLIDRRVTGGLLLQFIVDTTGLADLSTVKDLWPSSRPRPSGQTRQYYESFRRAIVRALPDARFKPARIGGCKVRQLVQMPFGFDLAR